MKTAATAMALSLALTGCGVDRALHVASSVTAHELCSQTFVAGRDPGTTLFHDYVQPFIGVAVVADRLALPKSTASGAR